MTDGQKWSLEFALKVGALIVALFGVVKYFHENSMARSIASRQASVSFVERGNSGIMSEARADLFDFWMSAPEWFSKALAAGLTEREFGALVAAATSAGQRSFNLSLVEVAAYNDEFRTCIEANVCDKTVALNFSCVQVREFIATYADFLLALEEKHSLRDLTRGMEWFDENCGDF
jgi:hypothetical protein